MDLTIEQIKAISIVDYLSRYGYKVQKVQGNRYWYLSPLPYHNEKHASFKVDADINMWFDFAMGRITSYNVCYTKLLRVQDETALILCSWNFIQDLETLIRWN